MAPSYVDFYLPIIQTHTNGLKLVPGGTGIGKTSAIPETIRQSDPSNKFIYCANRVQLLNEMAESLRQAQIPYVQILNDADIIAAVLKTDTRADLYAFLDHPLARKYGQLTAPTGESYDLVKVCREYEQLLKLDDHPVLEDSRTRYVRTIISGVKRILLEASSKSKTDYATLVQLSLVNHLFPYRRLRTDPTVRIMLVTVQKSFYGFFDGLEHRSISTLTDAHSGYTIFLDEFDFLEHTLTDLICRDGSINGPFKFVEYFYRTMKHHKLPSPDYLADHPIRVQLEDLVYRIDDLRRTYQLSFPAINQFTATLTDIREVRIFETDHTVLTHDLLLNQTDRSFHLSLHTPANEPSALVNPLFHTIHQVAIDLIRVLKEIEILDPKVYQEIVQQCFGTTIFRKQLALVHQPPRQLQEQRTRFDALLDRGYGLYDLQHLQHTTDPDAVELTYLGMYTTPEKMLLLLTRQNLVFGLSATADIPRIVRGFYHRWLQHQNGFVLHPITAHDEALIQELNQKKQLCRANHVFVEHTRELNTADPLQYRLIQFIKAIAQNEGFGENDVRGYRRKRVEHFFATLLWDRDRATPSAETHLLFFNSYRQIKYMFDVHHSPEDELFQIVKVNDDRLFQEYTLIIGAYTARILFYNAEQGQRIKQEQILFQRYEHFFWHGQPTFIITTYPSAGNGINLQYRPTPEAIVQHDIQHVHLLDSPYFYFGSYDENATYQEKTATIKHNVWYLAKLAESNTISTHTFKTQLANVYGTGLNQRYHNDEATHMDAVLNRLATFIQAIGRVERVWNPMPDQVVCMTREVYDVFEVFVTREAYQKLRETQYLLRSNTIRHIFDHISQQSTYTVKNMQRTADERLATQNRKSMQHINKLVEQIREFRKFSVDVQTRHIWEEIRSAVLRHDIHNPILQTMQCWFKTDYLHEGKIAIDWESYTLYPPHLWHTSIALWDLNKAYDVIANNPTIRQYFAQQGYELAFRETLNAILTPHCYQAIFLGALGEMGVQALLNNAHVRVSPLPDSLFEIVDLHVTNTACYIDCKNYTGYTIDHFNTSFEDPHWRSNLNRQDFMQLAQQKLATLHKFHQGSDHHCQLIYINLISDSDRVNQYFDANFTPVRTPDEASIILVQGAITSSAPTTLTAGMQTIIDLLNRYQHR